MQRHVTGPLNRHHGMIAGRGNILCIMRMKRKYSKIFLEDAIDY